VRRTPGGRLLPHVRLQTGRWGDITRVERPMGQVDPEQTFATDRLLEVIPIRRATTTASQIRRSFCHRLPRSDARLATLRDRCRIELIASGLFHRAISNSPDCAPRYAVYAGSAVNQPARRKLGAMKAGSGCAVQDETSALHLR
jgi:hypothetical protein